MRAHRVFMGLAISIGCGIAVQNVAFSQENRGTMDQQMACTPDVWRFCGAQVPDVDRIVACLRRNTPQLSGPCRAVFETSAAPQQQAAPRGRAQPRPYPEQGRPYDDRPRAYDDRPRRYDDRPRPYDDRPRPYDDDE